MPKLRSIDDQVLIRAIVEGKTLLEAGKIAGYKSKDKSIVEEVSRKINNNQNIKKDIISQLEEKRQQVLDAMTSEKAQTQNLVQLSTSLGIITDKIQLLKGDPTERIETIPRMVIERIRVNPPTQPEVYTQPVQE